MLLLAVSTVVGYESKSNENHHPADSGYEHASQYDEQVTLRCHESRASILSDRIPCMYFSAMLRMSLKNNAPHKALPVK